MTQSLSNRRQLLWRGATLSLVATGGLLTLEGCADATGTDTAYSAWSLWNDPKLARTPLALVAAAVLAANPHDTQPWRFRVSADAIEIAADTSRHLGTMDPFLREMHIGLGCALENIALAAPVHGYRAEFTLEPGSLLALTLRGGSVRAATVRLSRAATSGATSGQFGGLFEMIPRRHTNRYPYDRKIALPAGWRETLRACVDTPEVKLVLFEQTADLVRFRAMMTEATEAIIRDPVMIADSDRWFRNSPAEIEKFRSGPNLDTAGLPPLTRMLARMIPVSEDAQHKAWLNQTRDAQVGTADVFGVLAVRDLHDRRACLTAGRVWQRMHLSAVSREIAMQPLNQPWEVVDRARQLGQPGHWAQRLGNLIGASAGAPSGVWSGTFSFRLGMSTHAAPASPRRALADVLVTDRA